MIEFYRYAHMDILKNVLNNFCCRTLDPSVKRTVVYSKFQCLVIISRLISKKKKLRTYFLSRSRNTIKAEIIVGSSVREF